VLVNLTPHPIRIYPPDAPDRLDPDEWVPTIELPVADQPPARIGEQTLGTASYIGAIPIEYVEYASHGGTVHPIPPVQRDDRGEPAAFYVVSLVVGLVLTYSGHNRPDLLVPYREVRNLAGTVIGCRQLARPV
jgi:hypothetical protein